MRNGRCSVQGEMANASVCKENGAKWGFGITSVRLAT